MEQICLTSSSRGLKQGHFSFNISTKKFQAPFCCHENTCVFLGFSPYNKPANIGTMHNISLVDEKKFQNNLKHLPGAKSRQWLFLLLPQGVTDGDACSTRSWGEQGFTCTSQNFWQMFRLWVQEVKEDFLHSFSLATITDDHAPKTLLWCCSFLMYATASLPNQWYPLCLQIWHMRTFLVSEIDPI